MKSSDKENVLIFGVGNTGRQDDGLGWLFLDYLERLNLNFRIEYRYQLQIEDAELLSHYNTVLFIDATKEKTEKGYSFKECNASENYSFSTHALNPETILFLTNSIYKKFPKAFVLGIEGYTWELEIGLSKVAKQNLSCVTKVFTEKLLNDYLYVNN